jgi:hypothetical protein
MAHAGGGHSALKIIINLTGAEINQCFGTGDAEESGDVLPKIVRLACLGGSGLGGHAAKRLD